MPCAPLEPQEDIDKEVKPQEYIDKEVADALLAANAAPTRTYLTKEGKGFVDEHLAEWIRRGADGVKGSRDAFISDILSEAALREDELSSKEWTNKTVFHRLHNEEMKSARKHERTLEF